MKNFLRKNKADTNIRKKNLELLKVVEPFLDLSLDEARLTLIDKEVYESIRPKVKERLINADESLNLEALVDLITEIKTDISYLSAAYVESARYKEPIFDVKTASENKNNVLNRSEINIDMRDVITGGNWYSAEQDGRWSGPENTSTIMTPALTGKNFDIALEVVDQIHPDVINNMTIKLNGHVLKFECNLDTAPFILTAEYNHANDYMYPFWVFKFEFGLMFSPSEFGSPDKRKLGIRLKSVAIKAKD